MTALARPLSPLFSGEREHSTQSESPRMLEPQRGAWATFQFLVRERLLESGADVSPEGGVRQPRGRRRKALSSCEALTLPQMKSKGLKLQLEPCAPTLTVHADRERAKKTDRQRGDGTVRHAHAPRIALRK